MFELYRQYAKVLEKSDLNCLVNAYRKTMPGIYENRDELKDLAPELEKLNQLMADIWYKNVNPLILIILMSGWAG